MAKINREEYETLKRLEGDSDDWKWMVRNSAGSDSEKLYVYSVKPYKDYGTGVWTDGNRDFIIGSRAFIVEDYLFQFIQWEDEEPYNIAWLLGEYEEAEYGYFNNELNERFYEESKEAEVKKDKKWLVDKWTKERNESDVHDPMYQFASEFIADINQLDETESEQSDKKIRELESYNDDLVRDNNQLRNAMDNQEVLSQEDNINIVLDDLKEHIKEQQSLSQNVGMAHTPAGNDTHYRQYDYVLECIDEYEPSDDLQNLLVPEKELPEIPQFVSGWIEETKKQNRSYIYAIAQIYDKYEAHESLSEEENRIFQWMEAYDNDEVFARAWLDGYTIKKEPKYNVKIKAKSSSGTVGIFLYKQGNEVLSGDNFEAYNPKEDKYRLTEYEIKKYDERFWPFRKPVEEEGENSKD